MFYQNFCIILTGSQLPIDCGNLTFSRELPDIYGKGAEECA